MWPWMPRGPKPRLPRADRGDHQRALAGQAALAVAQGTAVRVPHAEGEALHEHAVEPALEDRGRPEPPQRELEHQGVGPVDLALLVADVLALLAAHVRALLLAPTVRRCPGRGDLGVVVGVEHRLPAHRVQVGDLGLWPAIGQFARPARIREAFRERCSGWANIQRTFMARRCWPRLRSEWPDGQLVEESGHGLVPRHDPSPAPLRQRPPPPGRRAGAARRDAARTGPRAPAVRGSEEPRRRRPLYEVVTCALTPGAVRTDADFPIHVAHGPEALATRTR